MFIIDENVQCLIRYENIFDKDKSGTFYNLLELSIDFNIKSVDSKVYFVEVLCPKSVKNVL